MGLMDKFKNLFTDEEIIEEEEVEEPVKIKEIKKEESMEVNKLPTFMREKIEKEEKKESVVDDFAPDFKINNEIKHEPMEKNVVIDKQETEDISNNNSNSFKFPIAFEESDFTEISRVSRQAMRSKAGIHSDGTVKKAPNKSVNIKKPEKKVTELYKDKKKDKVEEKKFKATPIISPIYGVLDKNYRTEELEPIKGDNYEIKRHSKNVDFDSVRKKAYGNLSDEIKENLMCENCEYLKKAKSCKKESNEDNLSYEALCEENDITLDEATENYFDYGVEYQKKQETPKVINEDVAIVNHTDEDNRPKKNGVPPVKSSINLLSTIKKSMGENDGDDGTPVSSNDGKDLELTDDLFSLIDSMYEEGKD